MGQAHAAPPEYTELLLLRKFPGYTLTTLRNESWIDVQNMIVMLNAESEIERLRSDREKQQRPHRRRGN